MCTKVTDILEQERRASKLIPMEIDLVIVELASKCKVEEGGGASNWQKHARQHTVELAQPFNDPIRA